MQNSNKQRKVISFPTDVFELLQTVQSGYHMVHKKAITYPELVRLLIEKGLQTADPKVYKILQLLNQAEEDEDRETQETQNQTNIVAE